LKYYLFFYIDLSGYEFYKIFIILLIDVKIHISATDELSPHRTSIDR